MLAFCASHGGASVTMEAQARNISSGVVCVVHDVQTILDLLVVYVGSTPAPKDSNVWKACLPKGSEAAGKPKPTNTKSRQMLYLPF